MVISDPISRATDICIGLGWRIEDAAPVIAAMMAWARLIPNAGGGEGIHSPGFFDDQEELTTRSWTTVLSSLRNRRAHHGDGWAFDDIEKTTSNAEPGKLESLRQTIREFLAHGDAKGIDLDKLRQGAQKLVTEVTDQDPNLTSLIVNTLRAEQKNSIYCGFDLSAPVALELAKQHSVFLELPSALLARLTALLAVAGDYSLNVSCSEPKKDENVDGPRSRLWFSEQSGGGQILRSFDHAVALPPFGKRYLSDSVVGDEPANILYINLTLVRGSNRRIVLMPDGFLFRTTKQDQSYKRSLIHNYGLNSVVSLPRGIIGRDSGVSSSLLIFDAASNSSDRSIRFVDCRSDWPGKSRLLSPQVIENQFREWRSRVNASNNDRHVAPVKLGELYDNDFNLLVDRYVVDPDLRRQRQLLAEQRTIQLVDLVDLYRPQVFKPTPESLRPPLGKIITMREVSTGDIHNGMIDEPEKEIDVWSGDVDKIERVILKPGDIVISTKGKVGVAGVVPESAPEDIFGAWTAGQSFVIARLRRSTAMISPGVLARYLASPSGQAQMQALAGGTTVPFIQMADLRRLAIPVPTVETQRKILNGIEEIKSLRQTVRKAEEDIDERERVLSNLFFESHRAAARKDVD